MRLLRLSVLLAGLLPVATPAFAQRVQTRLPAKPAAPKETAKPDTARRPPALPLFAARSPFAVLDGMAVDSLHSQPLSGAVVTVEGTVRHGVADSLGHFIIDSIPPGRYRLGIDHPVLDTIGISLASDTITFVKGDTSHAVLAVPGGETLIAHLCPAARRALGPGALVGRVRDPDTGESIPGARVSVVWYDPDVLGLQARGLMKKTPRIRSTTVDKDGTYRLCGLPEAFDGKLQAQRKEGDATAEVAVTQSAGLLSLRSLSVAALRGTDSAGAQGPRYLARASGRVLSAGGMAVGGARVGLMGFSMATVTRGSGEFFLDSLPSGTQSLVVRKIGFRPIEYPVELSALSPARVTVMIGGAVTELAPVEIISAREDGLQKVGFTERKRGGLGGTFLDTDLIERRDASHFTDLLRTVPGIRVESGSNNNLQLVATRGATGAGSCVTVFVDGAPWRQLEANDLDSFLQPNEVAAIEVYGGTVKPAEFTTGGQDCAAVVVWTKVRVQRMRKK